MDDNEAPSEMITEQYALAEPYEVVETDYLGRPGPLLSSILRWDDRAEHLGPLLSRLVQLTRDIVEETDIVQSVLLAKVGMEDSLIHDRELEETKYPWEI